MYLGPEEESGYLDEMKGLALSVSPLPKEDTRQGKNNDICMLHKYMIINFFLIRSV